MERCLLGTNNQKVYDRTFSKIEVGDILFLYNYESYTLRGPFQAITKCTRDIEKDAFKDSHSKGFPFQVRISDTLEFNKPLQGNDLNSVLRFHGDYPEDRLDDASLLLLSQRFEKVNGESVSEELPFSHRKPDLSSHYIFRCSKITAGTVFAENKFGPGGEIQKCRQQDSGGRLHFPLVYRAAQALWRLASKI